MKKRKINLTTFHTTLTVIFLIILIFAFAESLGEKDYFSMFIISLAFIFMFIPTFFEKFYKIDIPIEFELATVIFIFASIFLGEYHGYYTRFFWWDILLHGLSALTLGIIGFMIIFFIYKHNKVKASPIFLSIFAFSFALSIGALWEIAEFTIDQTLGTNMQKSGLLDTMADLIIDAIGALVASTLGFFYLHGKEGLFLSNIINEFEKTNPGLFGQ